MTNNIHYKGKGEHSVNELEKIIEQQNEKLHQLRSKPSQPTGETVLVKRYPKKGEYPNFPEMCGESIFYVDFEGKSCVWRFGGLSPSKADFKAIVKHWYEEIQSPVSVDNGLDLAYGIHPEVRKLTDIIANEHDEIEYKNELTNLICDLILKYDGSGKFGGEKIQQIADLVLIAKTTQSAKSGEDIYVNKLALELYPKIKDVRKITMTRNEALELQRRGFIKGYNYPRAQSGLNKEEIIKCLKKATDKSVSKKGVEWKLLYENAADLILSLPSPPPAQREEGEAVEKAFEASRKRISHPDFDYVYETFQDYIKETQIKK